MQNCKIFSGNTDLVELLNSCFVCTFSTVNQEEAEQGPVNEKVALSYVQVLPGGT